MSNLAVILLLVHTRISKLKEGKEFTQDKGMKHTILETSNLQQLKFSRQDLFQIMEAQLLRPG